MALLYSHAGEAAEAERMHERQLELWDQWDRKLPNNEFCPPPDNCSKPSVDPSIFVIDRFWYE